MKKIIKLIIIILFFDLSANMVYSQQEIKIVNKFINMIKNKDEFYNRDACVFKFWWPEAYNLNWDRFTLYLDHDPCDKNMLMEKSEVLTIIKEWFLINNYKPDNAKIIVTTNDQGNYTVSVKFPDNKILYFSVLLREPYKNAITSIRVGSDRIENDIGIIIGRMFDKKKYTISASSTRDSRNQKYSYSVNNLNDNFYNTPWVAGGNNSGIGEYLIYKFNKGYKIEGMFIINGCIQNDYLFKVNNRVKILQVEFNDKKKIINLKDTKKGQVIPIGDKVSEIKLTILDVYKGNKYPKDTCIGELRPGINEE